MERFDREGDDRVHRVAVPWPLRGFCPWSAIGWCGIIERTVASRWEVGPRVRAPLNRAVPKRIASIGIPLTMSGSEVAR